MRGSGSFRLATVCRIYALLCLGMSTSFNRLSLTCLRCEGISFALRVQDSDWKRHRGKPLAVIFFPERKHVSCFAVIGSLKGG